VVADNCAVLETRLFVRTIRVRSNFLGLYFLDVRIYLARSMEISVVNSDIAPAAARATARFPFHGTISASPSLLISSSGFLARCGGHIGPEQPGSEITCIFPSAEGAHGQWKTARNLFFITMGGVLPVSGTAPMWTFVVFGCDSMVWGVGCSSGTFLSLAKSKSGGRRSSPALGRFLFPLGAENSHCQCPWLSSLFFPGTSLTLRATTRVVSHFAWRSEYASRSSCSAFLYPSPSL